MTNNNNNNDTKHSSKEAASEYSLARMRDSIEAEVDQGEHDHEEGGEQGGDERRRDGLTRYPSLPSLRFLDDETLPIHHSGSAIGSLDLSDSANLMIHSGSSVSRRGAGHSSSSLHGEDDLRTIASRETLLEILQVALDLTSEHNLGSGEESELPRSHDANEQG